MKESSFVVFLGFLMSASSLSYTSFQFNSLHSNFTFTSTSILTASKSIFYLVLIFYSIAYVIYFKTLHCSFVLECCEYLAPPISTFAITQKISIIKRNSQLNSIWDIFDILLFVIVLGLTIFKIVYINQPFPNEKEKIILAFSRRLKIFKITKFLLNSVCFWIFAEKDFFIIFSFLNVLDFMITFCQINFIDSEIESAATLSNFNNILSVLCHFFANEVNNSLLYILPELILMLIFFLIHNSVQSIIEFKYICFLSDLENLSQKFEEDKTKKAMTFLLCCFYNVFTFEGNEISVNQISTNKWSINFQKKLKEKYMEVLYFYMGRTEDCLSKSFNKEVDNTEALSGYERRITKTIIKTVKNETEFKAKLIKNYKEHFNKETKASDILANKKLFFDCLYFIIGSLKEKEEQKQISWSYLDEFILVFTSNLNQRFLIEQIKTYQLRLCIKEESIISVTRNKKIHKYLIFCQEKFDGTEESELEKYLNFEHFLKEIKQEIFKCCSKERKFIENLGKPIKNIFWFESNLKERNASKKVMTDLFEKGFQNKHYLNNQEFTYIYLTFMIVFCKSIHITSQNIHQKFRIPLKKNHKESNSFHEQPVIVCCGTNDLIGYTLGEILISNVVFRKVFGVCKSNTLNKNININDMIPDWSQKENHIELFLRSFNFEPKAKKDHSTEKCFLKVNLMRENFHIFQEFKISTKVFYSFQRAISFICILERRGSNSFALEKDMRKFEEKIPTKTKLINFDETIKLDHHQLNQEMELISLNKEQIAIYLPGIHLQETHFTRLVESSNNELVSKETDEKFQKFSSIENELSDNLANSEPFTLKIVALSIIPFILAFCLSVLISHLLSNRSKDSINYNQEISDVLEQCQGCQIRYSSYLYVLKKMQEGRINNSSCNPFYENLQETIYGFIESCTVNRLPVFFENYFLKEMVTAPILDAKLIESLGVEPSFMSSSGIDYFNYIYDISQFTKEFYKSDLINLSDEDEITMKDFIKKGAYVGKNSFSRMFNNKLSEINIQHLERNELKFNITLICGIFFLLLLFIVSLYYVIKVFAQVLVFLNLLTKLDLKFLKQRVYEMKFICNEVEKVNDFSFKTCSFPSDFEIKVETCTFNDSTSEIFPLNEFEKQAEVEFAEKEEAQEENFNLRNKESNLIFDVVIGKKWVFLVMILFYVTCIALVLLIALENRDVLKNGYRMARIIKEGAMTKESLSSINFQSWNLYFNDTSINEIETIYKRFEEYKDLLISQGFFLEIYGSFDSTILNNTAYLSICAVLERHSLMSKVKCESKLKKQSSMRSSDLLSFIVNSEYEGYQNFKENGILPNISSICKSMYFNRQFLVPSLKVEWKELLETINSSFIIKADQFTFFLIFIGSIFTSAFIAIVITNYVNLVCFTKPEVLTMDTVHDLYGIASFRPHLNNIYFKKCHK